MSCTINLMIYLSTVTKPIIESMKGIETKTMTAGGKKNSRKTKLSPVKLNVTAEAIFVSVEMGL